MSLASLFANHICLRHKQTKHSANENFSVEEKTNQNKPTSRPENVLQKHENKEFLWKFVVHKMF